MKEETPSALSSLRDESKEATPGLPPIDKSFHLDREHFKRTATMLVVGFACNAHMKQVCAKLRSYFPNYIRIPKLNTYLDVGKKLRKLTFLELQKVSERFTVVIEELKTLDVDVNLSPVVLNPLSRNVQSNTDNNAQKDFEIDCHNTTALAENAPLLTFDQLSEVRSPGLLRLQLTYDNFSLDQVLQHLLPTHVAPVTGFTIIGHVAHFNLKPDALPYRHVIGQAVIDKVANIRTVIHKAANIASDFRTFELDLMAGEPNYITSVCENQLVYHLDISKVYWNSRLGTEHNRVISVLTQCHSLDAETTNPNVAIPANRVVVYDVFAGIGPFSIPAARRGCRVFANDLNPDSYHWLMRNVQANRSAKRPLENITCYNLDGREFIRQVLLPHYWASVEGGSLEVSSPDAASLRYVVIMNLPALAPDFLDAFLYPLSQNEPLTPNYSETQNGTIPANGNEELGRTTSTKRPHLAALPLDFYCYCFVRRNVESEESVKQRIATALGLTGEPAMLFNASPSGSRPVLNSWSFRFVRNVAPFKDMYCAEFQLTFARPQVGFQHLLETESLPCLEKNKRPKHDS